MNLPPDDLSVTVRSLQPLLGYRGDKRGRKLTRKLAKRHPDLVHRREADNAAMTTVGAIKRHAPDMLPRTDDARAEALALLRLIHERIDQECDAAMARSHEKRVAPQLYAFQAELNRLKALVEAG